MVDIYKEMSQDSWYLMAQKAREKIKNKFDGKICEICKQPTSYATYNCTMDKKLVFICFCCRSNKVNELIYGWQKIEED